ncbi:hypothetical protein HanIR_Chr09g0437501 [Helianthus annuus]|nr:hypothetical protein HanIR_Chr09g0437501 [Helianthus annuus]
MTMKMQVCKCWAFESFRLGVRNEFEEHPIGVLYIDRWLCG